MKDVKHLRFWLTVALIALLAVWLLRGILLPFVAGMAIAYFLDPVCDRMQKWGLSRTLATTVVTAIFVLVLVAIIGVVVPIVVSELIDLAGRIPAVWDALRQRIIDLAQLIEVRFGEQAVQRVEKSLGISGEKLFGWATQMLGGLMTGGAALINLASLIFITPVVTFFLLRDWDHIVTAIDNMIPKDHVQTVRHLARQVDATLAGFVRGQGMVCITLGIFYALGLTLVGLDFGIIVGLGAGLISFIPYVGAMVGLVVSVGLALVQFADWWPILLTAAVFFAGQAIEGNFLTPKMVGERVGLHPVWVIFGLLAGGTLFGFVGVLLSVPAAAVIGVCVRFAIARYKESDEYWGHMGRDPDTGETPEDIAALKKAAPEGAPENGEEEDKP